MSQVGGGVGPQGPAGATGPVGATGPTGPAGAGGWQTTYEVDFTTLTPASFSNGTANIDGITWTFSGLNADATASLSALNGLQMSNNAGTNNTSQASAKIIDLGASLGNQQILIWTRIESSLSTSGGDYSLNDIYVGDTTQNNYAMPILRLMWIASPGAGSTSGTQWVPWGFLGSTGYPNPNVFSGYSTSNTSHNVRVIKLISSNLAETWTGTWSGGWPTWNSLQFRGFVTFNVPVAPGGTNIAPTNQNTTVFALINQNNGSTSSNTVSNLLNMRIQTK